MMLKRSTTKSQPKQLSARLVRAGLAGLLTAGTAAVLATGCLDRPVVKAEPSTSNVFVDQIVQTSVDKIDLLFMVDNSVSMADKQEILKDAVPVLVNRLIAPICVNATGAAIPNSTAKPDGTCTNGGSPEFSPIGDIHIGIVSSSLGSHGGTVCNSSANPDDKARLIGTVRPAFDLTKTWNSSGFLAWDTSQKANTPPGTNNPVTLTTNFEDMIGVVGESGCGFEASLESWYRFLIDPEPPAEVKLIDGRTTRGSAITLDGATPVRGPDGHYTCVGCDETLLAQRRAFLRPDSLVAIIMLSDENDCSIRDDGVGWFVGSTMQRMPKSSAACDANPNDKCCRSCATSEASPPSGCSTLKDDAVCSANPPNSYVTWPDAVQDSLNLRCYKQRQRFGFDLLYETSRYVNALKNTTIPLQSNGNVSVTNPLYDATGSDKAPRDPSLVFLAGIVGVPWQDIATPDSLTGAGLTYLNAQQLLAQDRWTALLGNPTASPPTPPTDPFMIETTGNPDEPLGSGPRTGTNPFTNTPIVPSTSSNPRESPINGHEQNVPDLADLQYACTFPLQTPRDCMEGDNSCDCSPNKDMSAAVIAANSPLCQGGMNINQQTSAKAYPGARHLQVLKDFGDNAIVASICPKVTKPTGDPASDPNYGYNPAVGAIIERLKEALQGKCLPRPLEPNAEGQVECKVIEAQQNGCDCATPGRAPTDEKILAAVRTQLRSSGNCGNTGQVKCETWCTCEIEQSSGADLAACQSNGTPSKPGYCYVNKALDKSGLVEKCPTNTPQLLRFAEAGGVKTPAQGSVAFIACLGAPVGVGSSSAGGPGM